MAIPTTMGDMSVTAASNTPAGSESPTNADDYLRAIQAILRFTEAKSTNIASASTTDLSTATGNFVDITGTTTITSFGTLAAGVERIVRFNGALTLTYNATSMILPGAASITTAANDTAVFRSLGSGNWQCIAYQKADGTAVVGTSVNGASTATLASGDYISIADVSAGNANAKALVTDIPTAIGASNAEVLARTATNRVVTPLGLQKVINFGTATSTSSGSNFDYYGIPTWANEITCIFNNVSTIDTSLFLVQVSQAGVIQTSGYVGIGGQYTSAASSAVSNTVGFGFQASSAAATSYSAVGKLVRVTGNTWAWSALGTSSAATTVFHGAGYIAMGGVLDGVRFVTTSNAAWDSGQVNIYYQ